MISGIQNVHRCPFKGKSICWDFSSSSIVFWEILNVKIINDACVISGLLLYWIRKLSVMLASKITIRKPYILHCAKIEYVCINDNECH